MSLYRGAGGASDATDDATVNAVAGYASSAASSAASAATSAGNASTSASSAATSASSAASSASSVSTNATNAASSAASANTYATQASNSKDAAAASAVSASTSSGAASTSASNAASSASTATTKAAEAATSASNAATSATDSANSAASALAIYGNTATMNAAVASASSSASSASTSASNAAASSVAAASSASDAATQASNAASSAGSASSSASSAASSAATATTKANEATTSALSASTAQTLAYQYVQDASELANAAQISANDAEASAAQAQVVLDESLAVAYTSFLSIPNNLSDIGNASIARTNLGLGTAATYNAAVPNGAATLNSSGFLSDSQIPSTFVSGTSYRGAWNASTNSPTLTSSVGTRGYYYVVSTAGSTTLNGISSWAVGDWVIFNGTTWEKIVSYSVISGGLIDNTPVGSTTASTGKFTTLNASGNTVVSNVNVLGAVYDSVSFSVAGQETFPTELFFSPDGLKMYVLGDVGNDVNEYNLSTAWVISSAVFVTNFSVSSQETNPAGLFFRADGTKMYMVGATNDTVYQYTLSTPWSVATASYDSISFSVASQEATPSGLWFKPNGLSMYMVGSSGDLVYQYTLSTAWNVSTATFLQSFSVAGQETSPNSVVFTGDGSRMFVLGDAGNDVNVYNLTTPWDISTAAFVNVFSVSGQDTAPLGLYIKPDGTKMYMVGAATDTVYQYTVPSIDIQLTGPTSAAALDVQQDLNVYGNTTGSFLNNGFRENIGGQYYNLVSQADIGTAPNEIPLNQYLGEMAYMNSEAVVIQPQASVTPNGIGDMVFQLTSDTSLIIKVKGSDGTVRSATLTLA
jgi:hypothetical protein